MGKYPIYAIVALIFIAIIKLLQISAFDAEKYNKNKEASFSKGEVTTNTVDDEEAESEFNPVDLASQVAKETPPPVLDRTKNDSIESSLKDEADDFNSEDNNNSTFESTEQSNPTTSYGSLNDLKNIYLAPKIANLPPGQLRDDVVIRYYRHDQDADKVYSLKELGYYIHEKEAVETAGMGSNVLYYGDDVNTEDIQIVAYTLLSAGLPIKSIEPTRFSWKSNAIEIGTNPELENASNLTADDVKSFRK
ncbi:hypothetical protein [Ekhidna sp.]|uniref:hypothetical protein n=1 Tax=Ekhidna sp. TaxID=2608089 RepID=UPI0032EEB95D